MTKLMPPCVVVHQDRPDLAAMKGFAAKHGLSVITSSHVDPERYYIYKGEDIQVGTCPNCDFLDVPCQQHTASATVLPAFRVRTPGLILLYHQVKRFLKRLWTKIFV